MYLKTSNLKLFYCVGRRMSRIPSETRYIYYAALSNDIFSYFTPITKNEWYIHFGKSIRGPTSMSACVISVLNIPLVTEATLSTLNLAVISDILARRLA